MQYLAVFSILSDIAAWIWKGCAWFMTGPEIPREWVYQQDMQKMFACFAVICCAFIFGLLIMSSYFVSKVAGTTHKFAAWMIAICCLVICCVIGCVVFQDKICKKMS